MYLLYDVSFIQLAINLCLYMYIMIRETGFFGQGFGMMEDKWI